MTEPEFDVDQQPQEEIDVEEQEEVVDDEGSELQLSTASELSEKSEVESRISQESMDDHEVSDQESDVVEIASESEPDEPMVGGETTIAMTPSSRKSMVAQFFENDEAEESEVNCTVQIIKFNQNFLFFVNIFDHDCRTSLVLVV